MKPLSTNKFFERFTVLLEIEVKDMERGFQIIFILSKTKDLREKIFIIINVYFCSHLIGI